MSESGAAARAWEARGRVFEALEQQAAGHDRVTHSESEAAQLDRRNGTPAPTGSGADGLEGHRC